MSGDIQEAKQNLPLPALIHRLGLGKHAKKSAKCPFHDDRHNSFSVWRNGTGLWFWKCHTGCGEGDEITFLEKHYVISNKDATKLFLEMAGGNDVAPTPSKATSASTSKPASPLDWRACVEAFTDQHVHGLAQRRGYRIELVSWLKENGLVGLYYGHIAFPVHDCAGKLVAAHYRVKDGSWRYYPRGAKMRPLIVGELVAGDPVHIFESPWDAFAFMDKSGEHSGIVVTRGASNGALVAGLIPKNSKVYVWTQNDSAGEKWQQDICSNTKGTVKRVHIPVHKDLNDWTRAEASDQNLLDAIINAETVQEAPPALSPDQLFRASKSFVNRYVVFSRPEHADVITLWIMHTWVADYADFTPYIYLHSPVMRCGKTQVHRIVEPLVKNPLRTCNISESALFREITDSHPTLLWDEVDSIFGSRKASEANENKRALLNAGYERGIRAIRMEHSADGIQKNIIRPVLSKDSGRDRAVARYDC